MSWADCQELLVPIGTERMWIASICDRGQLDGATEPDRDEVAMIRSYIEFMCLDFYGMPFDQFVERWSSEGSKPYAAISGHNTVTFLRRARGDWAYQRFTWRSGPPWVPMRYQDREPRPEVRLTLAELLDRINAYGNSIMDADYRRNPRWDAWKAAHPEVFGG